MSALIGLGILTSSCQNVSTLQSAKAAQNTPSYVEGSTAFVNVDGTDAPQLWSVPGFSIQHEIVAMQKAGMTPEQILTSGTSVIGLYFKDVDNFGTVGVNQRADLILLNENPIDNLYGSKHPPVSWCAGSGYLEVKLTKNSAKLRRERKNNLSLYYYR